MWTSLRHVQLFVTPSTLQSVEYSPWNSPGQNTRVGSRSLLQGIVPTRWSNPGVPHCRRILYQLSHEGSPRMLEWVSSPFSRGTSRPGCQTGVSCLTGRFFTGLVSLKLITSHFSFQDLPQSLPAVSHRWFPGVPFLSLLGGSSFFSIPCLFGSRLNFW